MSSSEPEYNYLFNYQPIFTCMNDFDDIILCIILNMANDWRKCKRTQMFSATFVECVLLHPNNHRKITDFVEKKLFFHIKWSI